MADLALIWGEIQVSNYYAMDQPKEEDARKETVDVTPSTTTPRNKRKTIEQGVEP